MQAMINIFIELMPQYAHYVARLEESTERTGARHADHLHHVWLIEKAGEPAAMAAFEYVRRWNIGLGMDIAVYPALRRYVLPDGRPLAHAILDAMVEALQDDARQFGSVPYTVMGGEVHSDRLLERFQTYGMVEIPITYYEPPDVSGQHDLQGFSGTADEIAALEALGYHAMHLGMFPPKNNTALDIYDRELWRRLVHAYYIDHYKLQADSRALQIALHSIEQFQPSSA